MSNKIYYIIGVSSCGKSTIGQMLSDRISVPFFDGDDFHPAENITKMKSGQALNDEDRQGWLESINALAIQQSKQSGAIIACSALKKKYRKILRKNIEAQAVFIFLKGDWLTIKNRMEKRSDHFMPIELLQAQFDDLEEPTTATIIDVSLPPEQIIEIIIQ